MPEQQNNPYPLVSVLITAFNGMPYLDRAIDSLLCQTYSNIEIIVIEDGSNDTTWEYLSKKSVDNPYVFPFKNPKKGRGNALNFGLTKCKGKYVAINDSDDISKPERIKRQVEFLETNPDYGLVGTMSEMIDLDSGELLSYSYHRPKSDEDIRRYFMKGQPIQHVTVMYRKQLADSVGGYNLKIKFLFDRDIFIRLAKVSKLYNMDENLVQVGEHRNRFFKYNYFGIERSWLSTKYQIKAVLEFGFPFYHIASILASFAYSVLRNLFRLNPNNA